ncbi:hypothetical protein LTR36_002029 [Oleoguttula mirabilis]|uniref:Uncharacterized protein n=1 Tax=Oleoguttula mirabilis TaxID=1507867 RepID=A0AAV9JM04_9PEZI|nr:hypothetical protein LTR36_002029 [Oleoguttula mirabilis]
MDSHSQMIVASRPSPADVLLTASRLLQLPGELRNKVYSLTLGDLSALTTNIVRSRGGLLPCPLGVFTKPAYGLRAPNLTLRLCCRQIKREVTLYWLRNSTFGVYLRDAGANRRCRSYIDREAQRFAGVLGRSMLSKIQHLELGLDDLNLFFHGLVKQDSTPSDSQLHGTARQQWLVNVARLGPQSLAPPANLPDLWSAICTLAIGGMKSITTVTLHGNRIDCFPQSVSREYAVDLFFVLLKMCFGGLKDLRVVSTVPVPYGRRFRFTRIEEDGRMWGMVREWYSGQMTFRYDKVTREKELSGPVEEDDDEGL